jgi:hypothetical protein
VRILSYGNKQLLVEAVAATTPDAMAAGGSAKLPTPALIPVRRALRIAPSTTASFSV